MHVMCFVSKLYGYYPPFTLCLVSAGNHYSLKTQSEDELDMDVSETDNDAIGFIDGLIAKHNREYDEEQENLTKLFGGGKQSSNS